MKKWVFRIACILLILASLVFIALKAVIYYWFNGIINAEILNIIMIIAISAAFFCLFYKFSSMKDRTESVMKTVILSIMGLLTVSSYVVFFLYIPKYNQKDAYAAVKARPPFSSADVRLTTSGLCGIDGNPFVKYGYALRYFEGVFPAGEILFDPLTGDYAYYSGMGDFRLESEFFLAFDSQDFRFRPDNTVRIDLAFNPDEKEPLVAKYKANGKWYEIKNSGELTYLEENDVKAFLQEMGEQKLREQLDKIVISFIANYIASKANIMPPFEDLTIVFSLYDMDFASFHDGSFTLKQ